MLRGAGAVEVSVGEWARSGVVTRSSTTGGAPVLGETLCLPEHHLVQDDIKVGAHSGINHLG